MKNLFNHVYMQRIIKIFTGTPTDEDLTKQFQHVADLTPTDEDLAKQRQHIAELAIELADSDELFAKLSKEKADLLDRLHLTRVKS